MNKKFSYAYLQTLSLCHMKSIFLVFTYFETYLFDFFLHNDVNWERNFVLKYIKSLADRTNSQRAMIIVGKIISKEC